MRTIISSNKNGRTGQWWQFSYKQVSSLEGKQSESLGARPWQEKRVK